MGQQQKKLLYQMYQFKINTNLKNSVYFVCVAKLSET